MKQKQFLALLNPLEPKLFGFAYRMLRNEEGVKEAMQELRFRLWKKRKDLNTNKNIPAYCFRMMNNICIDTIRHNKKMINSSQSPYDEMEQSSWNEAENSISHNRRKQGHISEHPEVVLGQQELIANIRTFVDQLPGKQKVIVELHDFQDFSYDEIANMLDMEVNAVRVNLSRARARIAAKFRKEEVYG